MKLRKPCEHGLYDEHPWDDWGEVAVFTCPGGEFVAADALCQKCHTRRRLRKDGTFQAHNYSKGWPLRCEGSGKTP